MEEIIFRATHHNIKKAGHGRRHFRTGHVVQPYSGPGVDLDLDGYPVRGGLTVIENFSRHHALIQHSLSLNRISETPVISDKHGLAIRSSRINLAKAEVTASKKPAQTNMPNTPWRSFVSAIRKMPDSGYEQQELHPEIVVRPAKEHKRYLKYGMGAFYIPRF